MIFQSAKKCNQRVLEGQAFQIVSSAVLITTVHQGQVSLSANSWHILYPSPVSSSINFMCSVNLLLLEFLVFLNKCFVVC